MIFKLLVSAALLIGLAAPVVAFETPFFLAGMIMLLASFAIIALGVLWS